MSSTPIDLFAKKPEHQQRIERNVIRNKEFINLVGDVFFGKHIERALIRTYENQTPAWFGAVRYGYQVRDKKNSPNEKYVLFTGRSQVQQILYGKQQDQREVFQFKLEDRAPGTPFTHTPNDIGTAQAFDAWQARFKIEYTAQAFAAAVLMGMMEHPGSGFNVVKVVSHSHTFEAYLEHAEIKVRLRVFGESLVADDKLLNAYHR